MWDSYRKGGDVPTGKIPKHPGSRWPAFANDLANPEFEPDTLPVVNSGLQLQPGDAVAWPAARGSGHSGIIGCDGKIYSARSDRIDRWNVYFGWNSFRYRLGGRSPVYRRPGF